MNNVKYCPLTKFAYTCVEECAWHVNGDCAFAVIAKSLHNLKETWGKAGEQE